MLFDVPLYPNYNHKTTPKQQAQFAFFDFCAEKHNQIMGCALVGAVRVTPQIGIARVQAVKVAPRIGPSPNCGHRASLILWFGASAGGTSQNGAVSRVVTKFWRVHTWKRGNGAGKCIPRALQRLQSGHKPKLKCSTLKYAN